MGDVNGLRRDAVGSADLPGTFLAIFADTKAEAPTPVPPKGPVVEVSDPTPRIMLLARSE
jgi:hypothetical protein